MKTYTEKQLDRKMRDAQRFNERVYRSMLDWAITSFINSVADKALEDIFIEGLNENLIDATDIIIIRLRKDGHTFKSIGELIDKDQSTIHERYYNAFHKLQNTKSYAIWETIVKEEIYK